MRRPMLCRLFIALSCVALIAACGDGGSSTTGISGGSSYPATVDGTYSATVVTLTDEGPAPLQEDVTVTAFEDCVTFEQYDPRSDTVMKITLSPLQVEELIAALDLPEGIYRQKDAD